MSFGAHPPPHRLDGARVHRHHQVSAHVAIAADELPQLGVAGAIVIRARVAAANQEREGKPAHISASLRRDFPAW